MDAFDSLIKGMISDVKAGKFKNKQTKRATLPDGRVVKTEVAYNPWTNEALVLIATNLICDNCGNESMSWNSTLYIERKNTRLRNPVTHLERLEPCAYSSVYGALPKRVEVLVKHSCTCPQCFGIGDNRAGELTGEFTPLQLALQLEK